VSGKYDDILHLPHHVSPTRRRMTMVERAAQFSPFAALAGYGEAVRETGRPVGQQAELSEDQQEVLDRKQQIIRGALERGEQPEVTVTYFRPDPRKEGGEYTTFTGRARRIRETEGVMAFTDGTEISLAGITELAGELFRGYFEN